MTATRRWLFRLIGVACVFLTFILGLDIAALAQTISDYAAIVGHSLPIPLCGALALLMLMILGGIGICLMQQTLRPFLAVWGISFCIAAAFDNPAKDLVIGKPFPYDSAQYSSPVAERQAKQIVLIVNDFKGMTAELSDHLMRNAELISKMSGYQMLILTSSHALDIHVGYAVVCDGTIMAVWKQNVFLPDMLPHSVKEICRNSSPALLVIKIMWWVFYLILLTVTGYIVSNADAEKRIDRVGNN